MKIDWNGVYPAVTTKFTEHDSLDIVAFKKNLMAQVKAGVDGIILGGTLGEASTLTEIEKSELLRVSLEIIAGKVPVIINIAEQSTEAAISIAQRVAEEGANALMILPPMRYKADGLETVEYFKNIAEAVDLPIMIYNNPIDYKIEVTLDMFEQLAEYPTIQAVKESTRDVTNITRMINRFGDRFKILCGVDTLALESLVMGATGWVAGLVCAFPEETVMIYKLVKAKRYDEAIRIYRWFMPLLELDISPKLVQNIKLAETFTGLGTEHVRAPRLPLSGAEREAVINTINHALATRPIRMEGFALRNEA